MVNFRMLTSRAQRAKDLIEQQVDKQGGSEAVKRKADRIKGIARGSGSVGDRAKAAAEVAREKPNPASDVSGEQVGEGPIGGGDAPPPAATERTEPATKTAGDR